MDSTSSRAAAVSTPAPATSLSAASFRYGSFGSAGVHLIAPFAPSRLRHTAALITGLMSPVNTVAPTSDAFGPRPRGTPV